MRFKAMPLNEKRNLPNTKLRKVSRSIEE